MEVGHLEGLPLAGHLPLHLQNRQEEVHHLLPRKPQEVIHLLQAVLPLLKATQLTPTVPRATIRTPALTITDPHIRRTATTEQYTPVLLTVRGLQLRQRTRDIRIHIAILTLITMGIFITTTLR